MSGQYDFSFTSTPTQAFTYKHRGDWCQRNLDVKKIDGLGQNGREIFDKISDKNVWKKLADCLKKWQDFKLT